MIEHTVSDSAAHDRLLLLAIASGLNGCWLDVAAAPTHPQLQGEVVARQRGDDGIRYHGHVVGPVEGEDQGGIRRGKCGQSRRPISSRRWRWKEVYFTPDSSWRRSQGVLKSPPCAYSGFHLRKLTTQPPHWSVRVAVSITALSDVSGLQLYGGLDVPHRLLTRLQM